MYCRVKQTGPSYGSSCCVWLAVKALSAGRANEDLTVLPATHTHTHLTALCPGLPGWAGTRKVKPIWILLKQETVSGSGISWATCKSAPRSRQITTPAPHHSKFFTGRMPFLPPNQQCQSTEGYPHVNPRMYRVKKVCCQVDLIKYVFISRICCCLLFTDM